MRSGMVRTLLPVIGLLLPRARARRALVFQAFHLLDRDGFRGVVACIDPAKLDASFAGRQLDASFFQDLPAGVDRCGENGEFHTFVFDGATFRSPIWVRTREVVERDSFVFCDLIPGLEGVQVASM